MGAWGTGPFENDGASDWVHDLEEEGSSAVSAALELDEAYVDGYDGEAALGAAEVVAAALGRPHPDLPQEVARWVAAHGKEVTREGPRALRALERLGGAESEPLELWEEAGEEDTYLQVLAECRNRING